MEKHNSRFIVFTLILCLIVSLICGVSCSDSVDSGEDEVRMVNFSSEGGGSSSRGIESENTLIYKVEDLYWAYTAVKKSGQYTTGASVRDPDPATSIAAIVTELESDPVWGTAVLPTPKTDDERKAEALKRYNAGMDGKNAQGLVLKPVKAGVAPGLRGTVGPFSVGEWIFTVYGYESYNESAGRFENLIYTGNVNNGADDETARKISKIDLRTSPSTQDLREIIFNLNNDAGTTGVFAVGDLVLTVPEDKTFFNGSKVVVKIFDVTDLPMPVLVAKSVTPINASTPIADLATKDAINGIIDYRNRVAGKTSEDDGFLKDYSIDPVTGVASPNGFDGNFETGMTIKLNRFELNEKFGELKTDGTYKSLNPNGDMPTDGTNPTATTDYTIVYYGAKKDTKSGWAVLTAGERTFKVVAEYEDTFTEGDNTWDPTGGTKRYKYSTASVHEAFLEDGYEQVGGMDGYVLKITAGVKTTVYGDVDDLSWTTGAVEDVKFGNAVASITWTTASGTEVSYYSSLKDACSAFAGMTTSSGATATESAEEITLLMDIENDEVPNDSTVRVGGHFLHNVDITAGKTLTLELAADSTADATAKREYVFKGGKIVNFNTNDSTYKVWITTSAATVGGADYPEVTVDAETDTVQHSGAVTNLTITQIAVSSTDKTVGYFLGTEYSTAVTKVEIAKGHLYIGGRTHVTELDVTETTDGDVVLTGHINGVVDTYKYGTTELKSAGTIQPQTTALADTVEAFVKITLDANEKAESTKKYIYGIEGMPLTLPKFSDTSMFSSVTAPTSDGTATGVAQVFMHWNDTIDGTSKLETGDAYADADKIVIGIDEDGDVTPTDTLYAVWATPLGGRIFYIGGWDADADPAVAVPVTLGGDNYRFYGCAVGTKNELTEWKTETDPAAQIKALSSAVYYAKTADTSYAETCTTNLFVAYTEADPKTKVTPIVALGGGAAAAWDTAGATGSNIPTTEGIGYGKTNTTAAASLTGFWSQLATLNTAETYGYNDWFVGTVTENNELRKVAPNLLFEQNNIWSSVQGATTDTTTAPGTTYYPNAFRWNADSQGWAEVAKTETAMFVPIRMVTLYTVTTP